MRPEVPSWCKFVVGLPNRFSLKAASSSLEPERTVNSATDVAGQESAVSELVQALVHYILD